MAAKKSKSPKSLGPLQILAHASELHAANSEKELNDLNRRAAWQVCREAIRQLTDAVKKYAYERDQQSNGRLPAGVFDPEDLIRRIVASNEKTGKLLQNFDHPRKAWGRTDREQFFLELDADFWFRHPGASTSAEIRRERRLAFDYACCLIDSLIDGSADQEAIRAMLIEPSLYFATAYFHRIVDSISSLNLFDLETSLLLGKSSEPSSGASQVVNTEAPHPQSGDRVDPPCPAVQLLSASDLARQLGVVDKANAVEVALRRYAGTIPACREETKTPRRGEPRVLYRVDLVWSHLLKQLPRWRRPLTSS